MPSLPKSYRDKPWRTVYEPSYETVTTEASTEANRTITLRLHRGDLIAILRWHYQTNRTRLLGLLFSQNLKCVQCGQQIDFVKSAGLHHIRAVPLWAQDILDKKLSLNEAKKQCNALENLQLLHKTCHQSLEGTTPETLPTF